MRILKKNYKLLIGIIIGSIITGTSVYAATVISSKDIRYDNTTSKLSSTNVKDALDELSTKTELKNRDNIVEGYTYNQTNGASNYCITGEESTCVKTDCYKNKTANSCKAGDIIKYKVNDTDIVTFHVMFDNGSTMTMQSQKNTVYTVPWYAQENNVSSGPQTILYALDGITAGWTNVNKQTYTTGTTVFYKNAYTGCETPTSCINNTYNISKTMRVRMITVQETSSLGCTTSDKSCPKWVYNYLHDSTSWGGTTNDNNTSNGVGINYGYWTMSTHSTNGMTAWYILYTGVLTNESGTTSNDGLGARAVVEITK